MRTNHLLISAPTAHHYHVIIIINVLDPWLQLNLIMNVDINKKINNDGNIIFDNDIPMMQNLFVDVYIPTEAPVS